ncbi:MAG: hypothetical protein ACJ71H_17760 [Nitrososphaeraceae archaeon]
MDSEKDIKKEAKQLAKENNWDKLMHYYIYVPNTKVRIVPKRPPLLVNSYLRKKLMKSENMMVHNL